MPGNVTASNQSAALSTTAGGTTDFIKTGFGTPKACKITISFDASDDASAAAEGKLSIGFSDFTNNYCISHQDEDASAKVDCDARKSNTKSYVVLDAAGAVLFSGTASVITDGVRLTHAAGEAPASAFFASVTMYGGADLKISLDRTIIASAQNGTATITPGAGFDTSLIYFIGTDIAGEDSSSTGINSSFGVCHINAPTYDTFTQRCTGWASDHNNTVGSPRAIMSTDRVLDIITEAGGQDWGLEVTAAATNSIIVTTRDAGAGAGMEVYSLALDIDDRSAEVGSIDSPVLAGNWSKTGLSFKPGYVEIGLNRLSSENVIDTSSRAGSVGASHVSGSGEETVHGWYNENASAFANTNNNFRSQAIHLFDDIGSSLLYDLSFSTFDSGGWTYSQVGTPSGTASKWWYVAIEEATVTVTFFESPAMTAVGVVTFSKVLTVVKAPTMTAVGVAGLVKQIEKTIAITAVGVPAIVKQIEKTIAIMALGVVTFVKGLLFQQQPAMVAVGVAALTKTVGKTLAITAVGVVSVAKTISKTIAITAVGVPSVVKQIEKTLAMTAAGVASLTKGLLFEKSAAITAVGVAGFSKLLTFVESPAMTALGVVTLSKKISKTIAITAVGVAGVGKTIKKTISITASGMVTFSKIFTPGGPAASTAKRIGCYIGMRMGL